MKHVLLILIVAITTVTGCSISANASGQTTVTSVLNNGLQYSSCPYTGKVTYLRNARVIQTSGPRTGLASCYIDGNVQDIILAFQLRDDYTDVYDGLVFSGDFVMVGTYRYETVPDEFGRSSIKVVPLMVSKEQYLQEAKNAASEGDDVSSHK